MTYYALLVVVEAEDEEAANRTLDLDETYAPQDVLADRWKFVGDPWPVRSMSPELVSHLKRDDEFDTAWCIGQFRGGVNLP